MQTDDNSIADNYTLLVYLRRPQIESTSADIAGMLASYIENPASVDNLWNVKVAVYGFPRWAESTSYAAKGESSPLLFVPYETLERLKVGIWRMRQQAAVNG